MIRICIITISVMAYAFCTSGPCQGKQDSWPQIRGPFGSGISLEAVATPTEIDLAHNIRWQVEIPGIGWSSPVHDNGRIWLTTSVSQPATPEQIAQRIAAGKLKPNEVSAGSVELRAICVELETGELTHNILLTVVAEPDVINPLNSYASPTPAMAQGRVICHFGTYGTWCLNAETAELVWHKQLVIQHGVGPGSSPAIFENRVILVCDGMDQQFVAALDLQTGDEIWRTNRPPMRASDGDFKKSFSTPLVVEINHQIQAIVPGSQWLVAYDPATGRELWRADHGDGFSVTPMATYESGLIIFATGYMQPEFVAVDPTGSGDVTDTHIRWRARNAPAMSSFVGHQGHVYAVADQGVLFCLDAKTGAVVRRSRLSGNYSASPLLAAGKLYFSNREGLVSVLECSPELNLLNVGDFGSPLMASPAVYENDLIFRTEEKLYRIGK